MRRGLLAWAAALLAPCAAAATVGMTLIVPQDDARLERNRVERAYFGQPTGSAEAGVRFALADAALELEAAGITVELKVVQAADAVAAAVAAARAERAGQAALLTDLPSSWTLAAEQMGQLPLINVGNAEDQLREQNCRADLWHTLPSERMRADAVAQWLAASQWKQVLLLTGPSSEDAVRSAAARAAIARYGLKLVAAKPFKLSADPRERDLANPRLLTQGQYDAIWVVDSDGEFARSLPYRSVLPRPVVGDAGLTALAWQAQFDRFGAPQLSRRFARHSEGRAMSAHDWAAYMGGKAVVAAAIAAAQTNTPFAKALASVELDASKGAAMGFRAWDGQLRQRMLLSDGVGVIAWAPVEGILHASNVLDTLGADAPEQRCKAKR